MNIFDINDDDGNYKLFKIFISNNKMNKKECCKSNKNIAL